MKSSFFWHYFWNFWLPRFVRNGILRVCFYFGSTERNSELGSLPQRGLEQNYGSLLIFLFHGTEFLVFFFSAEGFGTEFRGISVPRNNWNSVGITIFSVYSVFRGIIFLSENSEPYLGNYFSNLFHTVLVVPLIYYCIGGSWDWTQDSSDFGIVSQTL